jgi:hypothetical protein
LTSIINIIKNNEQIEFSFKKAILNCSCVIISFIYDQIAEIDVSVLKYGLYISTTVRFGKIILSISILILILRILFIKVSYNIYLGKLYITLAIISFLLLLIPNITINIPVLHYIVNTYFIGISNGLWNICLSGTILIIGIRSLYKYKPRENQ